MTLLRADDYRADWYGYVCNQAGHAAIVGSGWWRVTSVVFL